MSYRPTYFLVPSVDQSQNLQQQLHSGISDPAEYVRSLLQQQACCQTVVRPLFCQLSQLEHFPANDGLGSVQVWREKFRWVKYEEELEAIGNRWSAPYVPVMSPFTLLEARRLLDSGLAVLQPVQAGVKEEIEGKESHSDCQSPGRDLKGVSDDMKAWLAGSLGLDGNVAAEIQRLLLVPHINAVHKKLQSDHDEEKIQKRKTNKRYRKKVHRDAEGCAIMVGSLPILRARILVFVRLDRPLQDPLLEIRIPVRFICLLLGSSHSAMEDLIPVGKAIATLMTDEIFHKLAYLTEDKASLIAGVDEFLQSSSVLPPIGCSPTDRIPPPEKAPKTDKRHPLDKPAPEPEPHEDTEGLHRTGRLFGGLMQDVKRKLPWYKSDFVDALHPQTLGSFFFIYFACIAPIITFGGMMSGETHGYMGAMECILSGMVSGVIFALFSGQPLIIVGATGPVLVFESIVFGMCERLQWEYMPFRWWIGMWSAALLVLCVAFDLSFLVKYITRFTEESFALLIAVIFIYESFSKLFKISVHYPVNRKWHPKYEFGSNCSCVLQSNATMEPVLPKMALDLPTYQLGNMTVANFSAMDYYSWDRDKYLAACPALGGRWVGPGCGQFNVPDVFFFSCLLMIASFAISYKLKHANSSSLFPSLVRRLLSDFAVMIAVCTVTLVDFLMGLQTPKLQIPSKFEPTLGHKYRSWLLPPFGSNPWYTSLIAVGPAVPITILLFLDQQITAVIVNRKENMTKKGCGYHLDLLVVAVSVAINSALGLPWFVAATVRSINHVLSLRRESECTAPGDRPAILGCRENRVTGLLVHLCIGCSVFLSPVLLHIPMPVLYGVFLFMGVSSLDGLQLWHRLLLFLQPRNKQPDVHYLREVKLSRIHLFTAVQLIFFALMWAVKGISAISVGFPLTVLSLCFARKLMDFLFTRDELRQLDDLWPEQRVEETIRVRRRSRASTVRSLTGLNEDEKV